MIPAASHSRDEPAVMERRLAACVWLGVGVLCAQAVVCLAVGFGNAGAADGLGDLRTRAAEYAAFREGVYPNRLLADVPRERRLPYTVYPPYALPMFGIFFEPGGITQGAILVETLSLGALGVIGLCGWRWLQAAGRPWAALAAVCAAAVAGNATVYQLGQFSILCTGLIVLQMACLERKWPVVAGVCWALAMLKPQIAAAFAVLFLFDRNWRGLAVGLVILSGLTLFACRWTGVPLERAVDHWLFRMPVYFSTNTQGLGPGPLAAWLGVEPRIVIAAGLGLLIATMAVVLWAARRHGAWIDPRSLAGVAAVLGELCLYHYHYDNVMLAPALFGLLRIVAARPTPRSAVLTALVMGSVFLPHRVMAAIPAGGLFRAAIWAAAAAMLLADGISRRRSGTRGKTAVVAAGVSHP